MKPTPLAFVFLALSWPSFLFPREVTRDEAMRAAEEIVRNENQTLHSRTTANAISIARVSSLNQDSGSIGYLVDLLPVGFIILSDVTELGPARFISYDADFSDIQDHALIQWILNDSFLTKQRLGYLPPQAPNHRHAEPSSYDLDGTQLDNNEALWVRHLSAKAATPGEPRLADTMGPLLRSRWSQEQPYNTYTPTLKDSSGRTMSTPTGCVATAQAQIMYYWKHPSSGLGSHSYFWKTGNRTLSIALGAAYNWNAMLDYYRGTETAEQQTAVATLMRDVGYSVNMDYGLDGSGAVLNDDNSLVNHFDYSSDVRTVKRTSYASALSWFNVFKSQLDNQWPSMLAIYSMSQAGHAVVVDGYRTDNGNQVHINMGWGGAYDSYYSLDSIYEYTLTSYQYAVINIHPPVDAVGPRLVISSVKDGDAFASPTVTISGTASDSGWGNSGVSSVTVQGVRASGDTVAGSGTALWSRSVTLVGGANVIRVVARDGSPQQNATTQSVTLHYIEHPSILISNHAISLIHETDSLQPPQERVLVTSYPTGMKFNAYVYQGSSWLTLTPASGTTPANVTISVSPGGLKVGEYEGAVWFESAGASNNPQVMRVSLTVRVAKLSITPRRLCFYADAEKSVFLAEDISVKRTSSGNPLAFGAEVQSGREWFSLGNVPAGVTPGTLRVFAKTDGRAGIQDGSISIGIVGSSASPERIPVTLNVRNRPAILVRPGVLNFSCAPVARRCTTQPKTLSVTGDATPYSVLVWTASGTGWLSVSSKNAITPSTLTISANPSGMAKGSYQGTITIYSLQASNSPQIVNVNMDVTEKTIPLVTPESITLEARSGSHLPVSHGLSVYTNGSPFEVHVSTSGEPWLSFDIITSSAGTTDNVTGAVLPTPAKIRVKGDPTGLAAGIYVGEIWVAASSDSPGIRVPITMKISQNSLVIPQIADGGGWTTLIDIVNTDSETAEFRIKFTSQDGGPLLLSLAGIGRVSEYSGKIPVGGTVTLTTSGLDSAISQGWAEVIAERAVGGAAIFRQHGVSGGGLDSEATVPIAGPTGQRFILPFDNAQDFATGIAMVNTGASESNVSVELRDQNGLKIGSHSLLLGPRGQKAFMLPQAFREIMNQRGVAEFFSPTSELAALGLRFSPGGTFTSFQAAVPVIAFYPETNTRTVSQIADGGGWKTTVILANPGTSPAPFSIVFHQPDGSPLSLTFPGLGARTEYADILPVGGVRILDSDAESASVIQGWAEIVASQPIAGTVVFGQRAIVGRDSEGTVQVLPPVGDRFVLPFDNTQGFLTALALLNQNSDDSQAAVILRDENGKTLKMEYLQVPAHSRQVFYLADRFPTSVNQHGSIEFFGADISILGLRFNSLGSFTSVSPIRK